MREHIIGDNVRAMMVEMIMVPTRVNANSLNNTPVNPPSNPIGVYTTHNTIVVEITGFAISRAPTSAA
ncbi:hypothetical protein MnTg03_00134 [bacterium MnTg03]|nr:hypothetical protein MnTg03_00134 [bacterium MnTg03]